MKSVSARGDTRPFAAFLVTGGIAAAFLGHAVTRFAVFLCTGHAGQFLPRGREEEEIDKRRRPPDGWRVIGHQESAPHDR